jgi:hypothetical protein
MVPLSAASIEKGRDGLLWDNCGGSTRRKGDAEARRLEMALMRLWILGEPRLALMGVEVVVAGVDRVFRSDGSRGAADGEATSENMEGLIESELVFDFLLGEVKMEGSIFSASALSSKTYEARRLPVDAAGDGFRGDEMVDGSPFCLFFALWRAWSRGVPSSAKGWRVERAIVTGSSQRIRYREYNEQQRGSRTPKTDTRRKREAEMEDEGWKRGEEREHARFYGLTSRLDQPSQSV